MDGLRLVQGRAGKSLSLPERRLAGVGCAVGAESFARELLYTRDPVRRQVATWVIEEAIKVREKLDDALIARLVGGGDAGGG